MCIKVAAQHAVRMRSGIQHISIGGNMSALGRLLAAAALASVLVPDVALSQSAKFAFPQACATCHGEEAKFPVRGVRLQYQTSGHHTLGNSSYSNGDGCQQCHTNEGFIEYAKTGKTD